ncbi:SDR family oxidoreductase [Streptomyces sp. NPDC050560]|uniref:SDR family oxidoreductase n=1 Tax=Streptomyces sp. NPDC050560 TaxID=3365630 RepID=UPI0037B3D71E
MPVTEPPVAIVTGAGSGIGRRTSALLAERGFHVVFTGRAEDPLDEAAAEARSGEARAMDVTDADEVDAVFDAVHGERGRVDLLVNCAGLFGVQRPIPDTPPDEWKLILDVNLTGTFLASRAALRVMAAGRPRGGRIVNLGSVSAQVPRPHAAAYTASKAALTGLTRSFALEGRDVDVAVGQLDIGNASTPMSRVHETGALQPDGSVRPEASIDVAHVAETIAFIAAMPPTVSVPFMTLMATHMPFMGRG